MRSLISKVSVLAASPFLSGMGDSKDGYSYASNAHAALMVLGAISFVGVAAFVSLLVAQRNRPKMLVPGHDVRVDGSPYPPGMLAIALNAFCVDYYGTFSINAKSYLECYIYFIRGPYFETTTGVRAAGQVVGRVIKVAFVEDQKLGQTALFHELCHFMIARTSYGHGDPDHLGSVYDGWTPEHQKLILRLKHRFSQ